MGGGIISSLIYQLEMSDEMSDERVLCEFTGELSEIMTKDTTHLCRD